MKHVDVINKIIEVEHQAQQLADQAMDKRDHLEEDLRESTESLRRGYMEQAQRRIDLRREQEEKQTAEKIEALSIVHKMEKENMEKLYREHREKWTQVLFDKIIAG